MTARGGQTWTRRSLLAALAGVPVASLVGCSWKTGKPISGQLLSPDFSVAHRLRDGWRPAAPAKPPSHHQVLIVGGGMAGLSAGWHLDRLGVSDYLILESDAQAGGTAIGGQHKYQLASEGATTFRYPWGAHYIPVPMPANQPLIDLLTQMGAIEGQTETGKPIVDESVLCREPEERVFAEGRWTLGLYPSGGASEDELGQRDRFRLAMQQFADRKDESGRRWFAIPMRTGSDGPEVRQLDQISMDQWMTREGYTSPRLRWVVEYGCRDDYGLNLANTSAWAGIFYYASRLAEGETESQAVMTWPAGNSRIIDHLTAGIGDRVRCSHVVTSIQNSEKDGMVNVHVYDAAKEVSLALTAEQVVFAAPQFTAPHLIANWQTSGRDVSSFRYGGWIVANVTLRDRPAELGSTEFGRAMAWDNVLHDSPSLGYVNSTHQLGQDHGATVVTWYHPLLDDDPRISRAQLMRLTWDDWASVVITDLSKAHPNIGDLIDRIDIVRWGHAMIQPRVGFVWGGERQAAQKSLGRIHFAGTDLSGIALMEEAFDRAHQAAQRCVSG